MGSKSEFGCSAPQTRKGNKMISKKEFFELTGENPEDIFGGDWENEVAELLKGGKENGTL